MRLSWRATGTMGVVLVVACGGSASTVDPGGGSGGAGAAGSGGSGGGGNAGAAGTGAAAGSGGRGGGPIDGGILDGAGGTGGGAVHCGGRTGTACSDGEFCDFGGNNCGRADVPGTCQLRPPSQTCPVTKQCPGVCGCDGNWYCDACRAHAAGTDDSISSVVTCQSGPDGGAGVYSAQYWSGGLEHVLIFKADEVRNVCLFMGLAWPYGSTDSGSGLSLPRDWGLQNAYISNRAADCGATNPTGQVVQAGTVSGSVAFHFGDGGFAPCSVDVYTTLEFAGAPGWVQPNETMAASDVAVKGGCM